MRLAASISNVSGCAAGRRGMAPPWALGVETKHTGPRLGAGGQVINPAPAGNNSPASPRADASHLLYDKEDDHGHRVVDREAGSGAHARGARVAEALRGLR